MARPYHLLVLWMSAGWSCSPELSATEVPVDGARSVLLLRFRAGSFMAGEAREFVEPVAGLSYPTLAADLLVSLQYRCSLAALGLEAGALNPTPGGPPLPRHSRARVARSATPPLEAWQDVAELPPEARGLSFARRMLSPCAEYETQRRLVSGRPYGAAVLGGRRDKLAVAYHEGIVIYSLPDLTVTSTIELGPLPNAGGFTDDTGAAWFLSNRGEAWRVSEDLSVRARLTPTNGSTVGDPLGSLPRACGSEGETFLVTEQGWAGRYYGGAWTPLATGRPEFSQIAGAYCGAAQTFLVGPRAQEALVVVDGALSFDKVINDLSEGSLMSVGGCQGFVAGFGTSLGRLVLRDQHSYRGVQIDTNLIAERVTAVAPTATGCLAALRGSRLIEYAGDEFGVCPGDVPLGLLRVDTLLRVDDSSWVAIGAVDTVGQGFALEMVKRRPGPEACD